MVSVPSFHAAAGIDPSSYCSTSSHCQERCSAANDDESVMVGVGAEAGRSRRACARAGGRCRAKLPPRTPSHKPAAARRAAMTAVSRSHGSARPAAVEYSAATRRPTDAGVMPRDRRGMRHPPVREPRMTRLALTHPPRASHARRAALGALLLVTATALPAQTRYQQTNLVSDVPGLAATLDPQLVNPWGISFGPTSPFWISDAGTGVTTLYNGLG